jgi:hypothetical protein
MNTRDENPAERGSTSKSPNNPTIVDYLRTCLRDGRREFAARLFFQIARESKPDDQRDALVLAAQALIEIGDKHKKRGRPTGGLNSLSMPLVFARYGLEEAIIARHFADGDLLGPHTLAKAMELAGQGLADDRKTAVNETSAWRVMQLQLHPELANGLRERLLPWALRAQVLPGEPAGQKLSKGTKPPKQAGSADLYAGVKRQGFRTEYRRRFAQHYGVNERLLKDVAPKVDV